MRTTAKNVGCACHLLRKLKLLRLVKEDEEEIHLFLKLNSSTKNERVFCFALSSSTPSPSNTALSSWFRDDHRKLAEFWDEESLFKYINLKERNRNVRCTTFTGSFCIMALQMKMAKSKFKFIITFKQSVCEENWNYFSKIKTQQDIETRRGESKQRS